MGGGTKTRNMAKELPIIKYRNRLYFFDDKAQELRNIEDASDIVKFQDMDMNLIQEA